MNKKEKELQIQLLSNILFNMKCIILVGIDCLNTVDITELRRELYNNNIQLKVLKNNLAKISVNNTNMMHLNKYFIKSTAIAWSNVDKLNIFNIIINFNKQHNNLNIKFGSIDKKNISIEEMKFLATLPSIKLLRIKIINVIKSIILKLIISIHMPYKQIINILKK